MTASGQEKRGRGTKRVGPWSDLDPAVWASLPDGALREVRVAPGVALVIEKTSGADTFRVLTRGGLPVSWLSGLPSIERVRRVRVEPS